MPTQTICGTKNGRLREVKRSNKNSVRLGEDLMTYLFSIGIHKNEDLGDGNTVIY